MTNRKVIKPLFNSDKQSRTLEDQLDTIESMLEAQETDVALNQLLILNKKYPNSLEILGLTAWAYDNLNNVDGYLDTILQMDHLNGNSADIKTNLADAYLKKDFLSLALKTLRKINTHWPQNKNYAGIVEIIHKLEIDLTESAKMLDFQLEDGIDFYSKHEELQVLMAEGKFKRCKQVAAELLSLRPYFSPTHNNLSRIYWLEGNLEKAIENSEKVLEFQPENLHALYSLCCFYFMLGNQKKVKFISKRLIKAPVLAPDHWGKKIRGLCFIGDDESVLKVLELAKLDKSFKHSDGILWHWCAVAEYRQGNTVKARTYWKKCLTQAPYFLLAQDNLEELKKPVYTRMCPQEYSIDSWFSKNFLDEMVSVLEKSSMQQMEGGIDKNTELFFNKHPEINNFIRAALISGDRASKETAIELIRLVNNPDTLSWLKKYALGKNGSDDTRFKVAQALTQAGSIKNGTEIKLWMRGVQKTTLMRDFNITFDRKSLSNLKTKVFPLVEKGIDALRGGNGSIAETFFRKAIELQSDEPSLHYNLAVALQVQKRITEAEALIEQIAEQFPDYFFVQLMFARKAIARKEIEKGQTIIDKLMMRKEHHITEFTALCSCQIDLSIADGQPDAAETWYQIWKRVYPEDPNLGNYEWLEE